MKIESLYNRRKGNGLKFSLPSLTVQDEAKECDINNIMDRFVKTGTLPEDVKKIAQYGDFSDVPDLLGAQMRLNDAQELFLQIPAQLRKKYGNNAHTFIKNVTNAENIEELIKDGLATRHTKSSADSSASNGESEGGTPSKASSDAPNAPSGAKQQPKGENT